MGRGIYKKDSNQWCPIKNIWTKQNGIWCPVKKVYTKVNGQWCLCFPPGCSYTITQFGWENSEYLWYSAGIDATKDGCFLLHQHSYANRDTDEECLNIEIFDADGNFIEKAFSLEGGWPQCVKKISNKIWFSYTDTPQSSGAGFYTIPWDETLQIYPVSSPTAEIPNIPYNWKVTQRKTDGKIFFCAAGTSSSNSHSIYYYNETNGSITKVVEIGGYSCGFDFDNEGNLWSGEYLWDGNNFNILPCRLGMWTKEDVDSVLEGGSFLTWDNTFVTIDLGSHPDTGFNWGVSDVVCDDRGNIYVSVNTYERFDKNHEYGAVIKVYKDEEEGNYQKEYLLLRDNTGNNNWDWFRSMTIDNNNLILDIDHDQIPNSPDKVLIFQI